MRMWAALSDAKRCTRCESGTAANRKLYHELEKGPVRKGVAVGVEHSGGAEQWFTERFKKS
jgi:hypothetical protein